MLETLTRTENMEFCDRLNCTLLDECLNVTSCEPWNKIYQLEVQLDVYIPLFYR